MAAIRVSACARSFEPVKGSTSLPTLQIMLIAENDTVPEKVDIAVNAPFSVKPATCFLHGGSCALTVGIDTTGVGRHEGTLVLTDPKTSLTRAITALRAGEANSCRRTGQNWCVSELPWLLVITVLLFVVSLVLTRFHKIAHPTRLQLSAEIDAVEARIDSLRRRTTSASRSITPLFELLDKARSYIGIGNHRSITARQRSRVAEALFWARGSESAGWSVLHEVEEQIVQFLEPEELRAGLERSEDDLRQLATPSAIALADRIKVDLQRFEVSPDDERTDLLKAVLDALHTPGQALRKQIDLALVSNQGIDMERASLALARELASIPHDLPDRVDALLRTAPPSVQVDYAQAIRDAKSFLDEIPGLIGKLNPSGKGTDAATLKEVNDALSAGEPLAKEIQVMLTARVSHFVKRWKALQFQALGMLYQRTDTDFATLASWQNKTIWLIGCSVFIMVVLGIALGREVLFAAGAAGGLLSRMERGALPRKDAMGDYGQSWARIFLGPVIGALTGWLGVALTAAAVQLHVLGDAFAPALSSWDNADSVLAVTLAFAMGFSERLFDSLFDALDKKLTLANAAASKEVATPPPAPPGLSITTSKLVDGKVGDPYAANVAAAGGAAPYRWSITKGGTELGLKVDGDKVVGTLPGAAKTYSLELTVTDKDGRSVSRTYSINVS